MGKIQKVEKRIIGRDTHEFIVESDIDFYDLIKEASKLSFPNIYKCGICGHDDLRLGFHKASQRFDYVTVSCKKCRASVNFGKKMDSSGVVYIKTKDDKKTLDWRPFGGNDHDSGVGNTDQNFNQTTQHQGINQIPPQNQNFNNWQNNGGANYNQNNGKNY